jgi:hypothetical protein
MSKNKSHGKGLERRDPESGRFLSGNNGGGRKIGSRNKLTTEFLDDVYAKWQTDGKAVLDAVCRDKPHEFLKLVGTLMPKEIDIDQALHVSVDILAQRDFAQAFAFALKHIGSEIKQPELIEYSDNAIDD